VTIVAARPHLAAHLDPMRDGLATRLGIDRERVNVKASSGNLGGEDGAGRSVSALALVTVEAAT
jgi:2C-methyl-D-erythritol 2,4-cyclodiphosphate synthase